MAVSVSVIVREKVPVKNRIRCRRVMNMKLNIIIMLLIMNGTMLFARNKIYLLLRLVCWKIETMEQVSLLSWALRIDRAHSDYLY